MGCSSSNLKLHTSGKEELKGVDNQDQNQMNSLPSEDENSQKQNPYMTVTFTTPGLQQSNLLLFTSYENYNNDFNSLKEQEGVKKENLSFKSTEHLLAMGYKKGYKLEFVNQDKFFVFLDGSLEVYCFIDGHGPFGNKVAQIAQDKIYNYVIKMNRLNFTNEYKKEFENLFDEVDRVILSLENSDYGEYDPFLSGVAVTLVIRINNTIFCANVGNILCMVFCSDCMYPSKFTVSEMTFNDSNFSEEEINQIERKLQPKPDQETNIESLVDPKEIINEIRRIYENGGELRKLQGETKSRIFIKGKYFPGLLNTRSLGDKIGHGIGVIKTPHITKINITKDNHYYLFVCTDGINNACKKEQIINLIQPNDSSKFVI